MVEEDTMQVILKKIDIEKVFLGKAIEMRKAANSDNASVISKLDSAVHASRRNLEYYEEMLRQVQVRRLGQSIDNMSIGTAGSGSSVSGTLRPRSADLRNETGPPPTPPPKDSSQWSDTATLNSQNYPSSTYMQPGLTSPSSYSPAETALVKTRPNYTKLDLIKYDTPYMGPRIQHMLSQIQFKLDVEEQYLKGIEKMVQLYQMEGDKKSKADAASKKVESKQKIMLLKQALKRYEELHIDVDSGDTPDDDSVNVPNMRKPLSGNLSIRIMAVKDVDHAPTGRFSRGPDTFVAVKVEDNIAARTRLSRTDRWESEFHSVDVDKANEIELTVYDKPGEYAIPIGMLWVRISDIAEEIRRKRIEAEINSSGWVSADKMSAAPNRAPPAQFPMNSPGGQFNTSPSTQGPLSPQHPPGAGFDGPGAHAHLSPEPITGWFNLEPTGQIQLNLNFVRQNKDRRPLDLGLGRKGAIRQKKEEVHEMYGHKFVQRQFYNIMRCALCGDFLKGGAGMQCEDCKYTCHIKCYSSVVTKCISKSNAETDPDEEKINHRIPHRFQAFGNYTANWCCHCGYLLPFGKKSCRKCSECGLTAHAGCAHLVPDFCGMSMAVANQILEGIRTQKQRQKQTTNLSDRTLRPAKPGTAAQQGGYAGQSTQTPYGPGAASAQATEAAKIMYANQTSPQRPQHPDRTSSASASAAAAAASMAMSGMGSPGAKAGTGPQTQAGGDSWRQDAGNFGDPYGASQGSQGQQQQYGNAPQQRKYNPADYINVGQYPPSQQQAGQMQQMQQPPANIQQQQQQNMYAAQQQQSLQQQPPQPTVQVKTQTIEPPVSLSPVTSSPQDQGQGYKKPLPSATDPGTGQRIGLDHFNFLAVLGKGNFGKVMLAETKRSNKLYAIKVLKKEFIIENDEVESIRSEKRVLLVANRERHPFLTNLHACFQTETRVYFVMEYISGGDLMLHIQRGQFGTRRAQFYASEVCLALKYLHENGVIYRDLKLDNILLTLDGHIKIADYGLCKEDMWYGSTTSTFCGTPEFMAPEILLDKKYGRAVDWWAFGVLIYQMLLQQSPFRGEDEDEIYDAILGDEPLYPIHMARDSVSILQKLLTRDPDQRLGSGPTDAQEIMSQPFFRNINWDDIYHKRVQPPFLPTIKNPTDTSNFDSEFTSVTPVLTPVQSVLSQAMQEEFRGFSYTADFV
ncbi:Serine/threonine kinase [Sporothrix curviconia]|uniref:protein kinase C n=1 Tax=Sporothrix curviconia TaxID=1260050 RepID=A0ABP0AW60_9PEZI